MAMNNMKSLIRVQTLTNIVLVLMILILLGVNSFVLFQFTGDIDWGRIFLRALLVLLTVLFVSNLVIDYQKRNNKQLAEEMEKSKNSEKVLDEDFDEFIVEENLANKRKKYIEKIQKQIDKLDKKAKQEDKQLYFIKEDKLTDDEKAELSERRKNNKYYQKRMALLYERSNDFIDQHLLSLNVKYDEIHMADLKVYADMYNQSDAIKIRETETKARLIAPRLMVSLIFAVFLSLIAIQLAEDISAATWIAIGLDLLLVITNVSFGISVGNGTIDMSWISFFVRKNSLYIKYFQWSRKQGRADGRVLKLIEMINKESEVKN
jgi:cell division protein FtsL